MPSGQLNEETKVVDEFQVQLKNAISREEIRNNYCFALKNAFQISCGFLLYRQINFADKVFAWVFIFVFMFCIFAVTSTLKLFFIFQSAITAIVYFYNILFEHVNHSVKKLKFL
jgi:hypothetical protein